MGKSHREYFYIAAIIILAAAAGYLFLKDAGGAAPKPVLDSVQGIFSTLSGSPAEVLSVREESGLYHMTVKTLVNNQNTVQDVYVTKDGAFLTDKLIDVKNYTAQLNSENNFTNCLLAKNVTIVGLANDTNSQYQVSLLGAFGYKLFFDCSNREQQCVNAGISRIPTTVVGNATYEGIQSIAFYEAATGCTL